MMAISALSLCVFCMALCLSCSRASAQGAVINGVVSGSIALDQTNFNFDNGVSGTSVSIYHCVWCR